MNRAVATFLYHLAGVAVVVGVYHGIAAAVRLGIGLDNVQLVWVAAGSGVVAFAAGSVSRLLARRAR